jgi:transposase-like protein
MLAAGKSVGEVLQSFEISEPTLSRWRAQYGGMKSEEAKRLKQLEDENQRLKKLVAENWGIPLAPIPLQAVRFSA